MAVTATEQEREGVLAPVSALIAHRVANERAGQVYPRDPGFVRRLVPWVARYVRYFSPEVRGIENLPVTGPVLVVGNHSCLFYMPDTWMVALAITARRGADAPAYALVYDLLFGIPVIGSAMRRLGAVPASGTKPSVSWGRAPSSWTTQAVMPRRAVHGPTATASCSRATRDSSAWRCEPVCRSYPSWPTAVTRPSWCCRAGSAWRTPSG